MSCLLQDAFDAAENGGINPKTGKKTSDYIDLNSYASLYWVNEITKNRDGLLWSSTYLFKDVGENSKITFGPAWDFDLSLGNLSASAGSVPELAKAPEGWYTRQLGITPLLANDSAVSAALSSKKSIMLSFAKGYLSGKCQAMVASLSQQRSMNAVLWGGSSDASSDVVEWLQERISWLESEPW